MLSLGITFCSINVFKSPVTRAGRAGTAQSQGDTWVPSAVQKPHAPHHPVLRVSTTAHGEGTPLTEPSMSQEPSSGDPALAFCHLAHQRGQGKEQRAHSPARHNRIKEDKRADREQCETLSRLCFHLSAQRVGKERGKAQHLCGDTVPALTVTRRHQHCHAQDLPLGKAARGLKFFNICKRPIR